MKKLQKNKLSKENQKPLKLNSATLSKLQRIISETKLRLVRISTILSNKGYHVIEGRVRNDGKGFLYVNFNTMIYAEAFQKLPDNFKVKVLLNHGIQLYYQTGKDPDPEIVMALDQASKVLLTWSEGLPEISFFGYAFILKEETDSSIFDQKFRAAYNFSLHEMGTQKKQSRVFLYSSAVSLENMESAIAELKSFADSYNAYVKVYAIKS